MTLFGKNGQGTLNLLVLTDYDSERYVIELHRPEEFISGRVDEELATKVAHYDIVCGDVSKCNGTTTNLLFHHFGLNDLGVRDFPECTLSDHNNSIHEYEKLPDPAHNDAPLLSRTFNFH